jgi:hypothetical protein
MAQPSEETKKSATSMAFSRISKAALTSAKKTISTVGKLFTKKPENLVNESSPPVKIMGEIYKMMKLMDLDRKLNQEMVNAHIEEQNHLRDKRNKEIIKALTTPKIKKPRVTKPKKTKVEEPEIPVVGGGAKAPTKPAVTPKTEAPATTPAPKTEAPTTTPKTTVSPKTEAPVTTPKTTAPKTAEPAKEIAGPPKPSAAPATKEIAGPPKPTAAPAPTPEVTTPSISTATKAVVGTAAVVVGSNALAGTSETASSIAKYESKASSPTDKGKKTIWTTDYDAYNKGTVKKKNSKGVEYDTIVPADVNIDFSKMTIAQYFARSAKTQQFPQGNPNLKPGDPQTLFAVGRYQIIPSTMLGIVKKLKLNPNTTFLTPDVQDYLFTEGLIKEKRPIVDDYLNSKPGVTREDAILELAKEFASIGVPYDLPTGQKKGQSYYGGPNTAHNPPEEVGAALDRDRASRLKFRTVPVLNNKGQTIYSSSVEGQNLKKDMNAQLEKMQTQQNINVLTQTQQQEPKVINTTKPNDSNPLLEKVRAG